MKRIGILSDTHGTFDDTLREFLSPVDEIWHAGDIGSLALADEIARFRPLRAVCGNIDDARIRTVCKPFCRFETEGVGVVMTHIGGHGSYYAPQVAEILRRDRPRIFVCGHSHILRVFFDKRFEVLHINPGAAGNYGFHAVRTALRMVIDRGDIRDMEVGEWPRSASVK